jgi:predicted RNA-binding protein with PUA-like domain
MPYLLKTEPGTYSFDDLARDGETVWDGISNNQALLNLRNMRKGDRLVIYHSGVGKAVVGTAKVVSVDASDPRNPIVRVQAGKRLPRERSQVEMRAAKVFQGSILFRQFRLSVVPLTEEQYDWLTRG